MEAGAAVRRLDRRAPSGETRSMPEQDRCLGDEPPPNRQLEALLELRARLKPGPVQDSDEAARAEPPRADAVPAVVVRRERKGRGGKTVTRAERAGEGTGDRGGLAKELKRALGAGARWEADDLVVQGDLVERVARWFEDRGRTVVRGN